MTAGRELDALVAEKVFHESYTGDAPAFSTDIAAAWLVVEKMDGHRVAIVLDRLAQKSWRASFVPYGKGSNEVYADTAPLAICLAALKAVEGEGT